MTKTYPCGVDLDGAPFNGTAHITGPDDHMDNEAYTVVIELPFEDKSGADFVMRLISEAYERDVPDPEEVA